MGMTEGDKSLNDYISEGMAKSSGWGSGQKRTLYSKTSSANASLLITTGINPVVRDGQQQAEQTVASAMMTGNKEGILPKSVDELKLIDPKVSDAWDAMKPTPKKKYMQALAQNARGERVAWTDDSLRNYQR